jgi:hypothetical protein
MLRKQRELEDAKREVELTVEKKVQENLGAVRDKKYFCFSETQITAI